MKKTVFMLIALFILAVYSANAQYKYAGCCIELITSGSDGLVWENDSIKFTFSPTDYFWKVTIENKTSEKAVCLWDETLFIRNKKSSSIIFDNTIRLKKDEPKGESIIASNTEIRKEIFPLELWWDTGAYPVFKKKSIKKEGDMIVRLIFPIDFGEEKIEYEFSFNVTVC